MITSREIKEKAQDIIWTIEEQTKIKHQLLKSYITKWMAILYQQQERSNRHEKLAYIDGFAGPGAYWRDNMQDGIVLGSPLLVACEANKAIRKNNKREFTIICLDKKRKHIDILNEYFKLLNKFKQNWNGYVTEFDSAINSMLDGLEHSGTSIVPIFFFIDPFGYSGFPIATLKRVMKYPRVELFINFNVYDVERFCHDNTKDGIMLKLFGCNEFKEVRRINDTNTKYLFLRNLYCKQLNYEASAKYVMPFRVNTPGQGTRPRYYLIHASSHIKALKEMKNSMANLSHRPYGFEAIGISTSQTSLFEDPEKISLKKKIEDYIKSLSPNPISYQELEDWAYINTNGIERTIKQSLCDLEKIDNTIMIERLPKQKKTTVVKGAIIRYIMK